ncbi:unnamed protein product [Orchesella dallaii]|uniref:Glutamate--tRNA ligase, mitochondrial n=1 Tax=Orchesella dallaii TaxID=48710 RepID=A0ABP1R3X6_9HEXA
MIEADLQWLGIEPHEGPSNPGKHGPYIQSERLSIYQENLGNLIDSGNAYECFCSEKRLDLMRREAVRMRQRPRYDNKCRDLSREDVKRKKAAGEQFCVRFKLEPEHLVLKDMVYGDVEFDLTEMNYEGDPIIIKSDGYPTYHYANVVDDHFMEISHVLRGVEWQISTPKHLQMYRAFKWEPPQYAHLPIVLNKDGTKLSKRQGDISVNHYRNQTYFPIALTNFVTKSGGGFSDHNVEKLYSMQELAETFDISKVNTGGCRLDFILLEKLNQLKLDSQINNDLKTAIKTLVEAITAANLKADDYPQDYIEKVIRWCPQRVTKIKDLVSPGFEYLWSQPEPSLLSKVSTSPDVLQTFINDCPTKIFNYRETTEDSERISEFLEEFSTFHNLKQKAFMKDLRIMLCGVTKGPPLVEIFLLFGNNMTRSRLLKSLEYLLERSSLPLPNVQAKR